MKISESDISIIDFDSGLYPRQLRDLENPVQKLFYYGSIANLALQNCISIVGTRKVSEYGKYLTQSLVRFLAQYKVTIVSGLAIGVDSIAHEAAINHGLRTVAVVGSGLLEIDNYSREQKITSNKLLANAENAIISEFEPAIKATKWTFPLRNRIIAALSKATIVIEASEKSGSLITAFDALKLQRSIFAFPGEAWKDSFKGSNKLLQDDLAIPLYEAGDLINYIDLEKKDFTCLKAHTQALSEQEKNILDNLKLEPTSFDELLAKSKSSDSEALTQLSLLEVKGFVRKYPGARFART